MATPEGEEASLVRLERWCDALRGLTGWLALLWLLSWLSWLAVHTGT